MNGMHGIIFAHEWHNGLRELTERRVPASVPFGGRYRFIDFMLSNMVNAGIDDVGIILSGSYQSLLKELVPDAQLFARACPLFVPLVENGYIDEGNLVTRLVIADYLTELRDTGIDTLILGCTHYPLLEGLIGEFMGPDVTLIDPGKSTADALVDALDALELLSGRTEGGQAEFYVSDTTESFAEAEALFLGKYGGGPVTQIAIEQYAWPPKP